MKKALLLLATGVLMAGAYAQAQKAPEVTYKIVKYKSLPVIVGAPTGAEIHMETSRGAHILALCRNTPDRPSEARDAKGKPIEGMPTVPGNRCSYLADQVGEKFKFIASIKSGEELVELETRRTDKLVAATKAGKPLEYREVFQAGDELIFEASGWGAMVRLAVLTVEEGAIR